MIQIWVSVARDNELAADGLIDRIEDCFALLSENPHAGLACETLAPRLRRYVAGNYLVFYSVTESPKTLVIERVLHGARDIEELMGP